MITLLFVNCPGSSNARQFYQFVNNTSDTIVHQASAIQTIPKKNTFREDKTKRTAETTIHMVLQHLPEHNPLFFDSYSAITHHRCRLSIDTSLIKAGLGIDNPVSALKQANNNYLLSDETLTFQKRLKPGFNYSEILSNKVEGKDSSSFLMLSAHLRDFSLLEPIISLFSKDFFSPFSKAALHDYQYTSRDSITASGDTLSMITFYPKVDKHLNGFTGMVVIDTKSQAIQHVSARSTQNEPGEPLLFIHQDFEQMEGTWLPSENKIKVFFTGENYNTEKRSYTKNDKFVVECTTQIYQQKINPPLSPDDFKSKVSPAKNNVPKSAASTGNYIYIPLNQNDSLLQLKADSAIIADAQNRQAKMIRLMAEGKISLGYFNLDYNKIFGYNLYEGIKIGLGGETSRLLSRYFTFGGYIGYGLKDKSLRHGEWIDIFPTGNSDFRIHLGYKDKNLEFGGPEFLETKSLLNPESYRTLLIKNMYATKRYTTGFEFRPFNSLNVYLYGDLSENSARQNTPFLLLHPFNPVSLTRTGLQLRYSPGIKLQMEDGHLKEITAPKSDYYFTIIQGLSILGGEYRYTKLEVKGKSELPYSRIGTTTIMVRGGTMTQNAPIIELFNGYGSFAGTFSLAAPYSFATMQLNEFAAANYSAIHLRHDFSPWLFAGKIKNRPALVFAQNIGIGQLHDDYLLQFNLQDYRKGFYESGFEVNNLLRMNFLSWGVGIYYRYGPYQFRSVHDNFAYKFGFSFKL